MMGIKTYTFNTMLDENELNKFLDWLPEIDQRQAYVVQLMTRSSSLKEKYGFKVKDHVLDWWMVAGYHEFWRTKLLYVVRRAAVLQAAASYAFVGFRYDPRTQKVKELYEIPPDVIGIYIQLNPANWPHAAIDVAQDTITMLRTAALADTEEPPIRRIHQFIHRPDRVFLGKLAKRKNTWFHTIDVDDHSLAQEVLSMVEELLGYTPPRIITKRGLHILVPIYRMNKSQLKQWFTGKMKKLGQLGREHTNPDTGAPLIEVKKQTLEPIPGTLYKGIIVRFKPEEM